MYCYLHGLMKPAKQRSHCKRTDPENKPCIMQGKKLKVRYSYRDELKRGRAKGRAPQLSADVYVGGSNYGQSRGGFERWDVFSGDSRR